jgi:hypothetical protein
MLQSVIFLKNIDKLHGFRKGKGAMQPLDAVQRTLLKTKRATRQGRPFCV